MFNPKLIANTFLSFGFEEDSPISPMKLLKLVYIAHGWHLGISKEPLINEYAEAWKHGPVIPSIYHGVKQFGDQTITEYANVPKLENNKVVLTPLILDSELTKGFLRRIWNSYKSFSGIELSMMTHQPGTPWYKTWHELGGNKIQGQDIQNDLIRAHYEQLLEQRTPTTATH